MGFGSNVTLVFNPALNIVQLLGPLLFVNPLPRRGMASLKGPMASELSEARMSVSVSYAWKRLVEVFSMTTVTDGMRANDSRRLETKNFYHNLSQLDVALPRPSEPMSASPAV